MYGRATNTNPQPLVAPPLILDALHLLWWEYIASKLAMTDEPADETQTLRLNSITFSLDDGVPSSDVFTCEHLGRICEATASITVFPSM